MIFNHINKQQRIQEWIDWCDIPIEIVQPSWGQHIPRGQYNPSRKVIIINGKQSDKEVIKSIIHEVSHWVNNDNVNDPDINDREDRCIHCESQWKSEPGEVIWI